MNNFLPNRTWDYFSYHCEWTHFKNNTKPTVLLNSVSFPLNELGNFPTKFGMKFTTLVQISQFDQQLCNEIAKFMANLGNFKWTLETDCQKYCETHCKP